MSDGVAAEADLRLEGITGSGRPPRRRARAGHGSGDVWKELLVRPSASVRRVLVCVVSLAVGIDAIPSYGMLSTDAVLGTTVAGWSRRASSWWRRSSPISSVGARDSSPERQASMASMGLTLCIGCGAASSAANSVACVASMLASVAALSVGGGTEASATSPAPAPQSLWLTVNMLYKLSPRMYPKCHKIDPVIYIYPPNSDRD
ncbi:polyol transporter 5-like [Panicum miliaceum]|uniref:Polyol transporter 5-like n=1 Tax=Panicum miliaceum TaxID=4540 RepID=A0A3L6PZR0_PANMI|nr:polyol transporter 5-like [Panicum miliaceum]